VTPTQRIWIGALAVACGSVGFAAGRALLRPRPEVYQPIAFNHQKHVEMIDCSDCHAHYADSEHSGLPMLSDCMVCHEEPQSDVAEEQRVRELAEAGEDDVFVKLFRLPDNVVYSHRRHVSVAGLECLTCHGPIAETSAPPDRPLVRVTMDFCIDCHEREDASTDCTACHR